MALAPSEPYLGGPDGVDSEASQLADVRILPTAESKAWHAAREAGGIAVSALRVAGALGDLAITPLPHAISTPLRSAADKAQSAARTAWALGDHLRGAPSIESQMRVSDINNEVFWHEMQDVQNVTTEYGNGHLVRFVGRENSNRPGVRHWIVANALGITSGAGITAEILHAIQENGDVGWNATSLGFGGEAPLDVVRSVDIRKLAKINLQAALLGAHEFGVNLHTVSATGASQGGGKVIHIADMAAEHGLSFEEGRALAPSSSQKLDARKHPHLLPKIAKQFLWEVPGEIKDILLALPKGERGKRAKQLIPTMFIPPSAIPSLLGSAYGIVFREGSENVRYVPGEGGNGISLDSVILIRMLEDDAVTNPRKVARRHAVHDHIDVRTDKGNHGQIINQVDFLTGK